jgi:hypothetical protein
MTKKSKGFEEPSVTAKRVELHEEDAMGTTAQTSAPPPPANSITTATTISSRPQDRYVPSQVPRQKQKLSAEGVVEKAGGETTENTTQGSSPPLANTNEPVTTATTSTTRQEAQYVPNRVPRHQQKVKQQKVATPDHHRLEHEEDVDHYPRPSGGTHPVTFPFQDRGAPDATDGLAERSSGNDPNRVLLVSSTSDASIISSQNDRPGAYREGGPDDADDMTTAYYTYTMEETIPMIVVPEPPGQDDDEEALEAEVVPERNLEQEVQERMERITIEATSVKLSQPDKNDGDSRTGSSQKLPRVAFLVMAALVLLVAVGAAVGSRTQRSKKTTSTAQTIVLDTPTSSPTSVADYVWELARGLVTPVSGEEALLDQSSPQYRALSWIVHDDPTKLLLTMVQNNDFSSSSSLIVERYVLMLLYFVTNGNNWSVQIFNGNTTTCEWVAIECNEEGSVVYISLGKYAIPV